MKRRRIFSTILTAFVFVVPLHADSTTSANSQSSLVAKPAQRPPNIIFLLADDAGYGDVSCFGQKRFETPNIDQIAKDGMKFTQHYAGSNTCAPSRCSLMSGMNTGHTTIRENRGSVSFGPKGLIRRKNIAFHIGGATEGQMPVLPGECRLPIILKKLGYATGCYGKWGLGAPGNAGDPLKQGFDHFYGYIDEVAAHNYFPPYLWDDDGKVEFPGNPYYSADSGELPADKDPMNPASYKPYMRGNVYSADDIADKALKFIDKNKNRPFFLYWPTTIPHLALQVPDNKNTKLQYYIRKYAPEKPYIGNAGYLACRYPRAYYAAMMTDMDYQIGRIMNKIKELGLDKDTIIVFSSDNGPLFPVHGIGLGGTDTPFFNSAGGLRGYKEDFYEGGFREPMVIQWPGHIKAGTVSARVTGFEDWLPTFLSLIGKSSDIPAKCDGINFAPTLLGQHQSPRPSLYRESTSDHGQQYVRVGNWVLIRTYLDGATKRHPNLHPITTELYNLSTDLAEKHNLADEFPDRVAEMTKIAMRQHVPSKVFKLNAIDKTAAK